VRSRTWELSPPTHRLIRCGNTFVPSRRTYSGNSSRALFNFSSGATMPKRFQPHLAEILIALVILGMLSALLFPATQSAREAARRISRLAENRRTGGEPAAAAAQSAAASPSEVPALKARYVYFQQPQVLPRRIIFDANIRLVVKKLADTETEITKFLKQIDGY